LKGAFSQSGSGRVTGISDIEPKKPGRVRIADHPGVILIQYPSGGEAVVPRWKKLAYSLVGVIVGAAALAGLSLLFPGKAEDPIGLFFGVTFLIFAVSLAGWLIAIPLILMINNIAHWRFWLYLGIGSTIGPILAYLGMILPLLNSYKGHYDQTPTILVMVGGSAILSCIATASYLLLLRRAQRSALHGRNLTTADR
jgi:hypothetical protein